MSKIVTGIVRFSYVHVWEKYACESTDEPKYSICILIDKKDKETLAKINKAIESAIEAGKSKLANKKGNIVKESLKLPLRDGDVEDKGPEYEGHYFLNASSKTKPGVVNGKAEPILDQDEFYSGCYGRASLTFFAFDSNGNKGIAVGLNHVMKTKDGDNLTGRTSAEDDFAEFTTENDEGFLD